MCKYGSIAKAARLMTMPYRHAWDLMDSMNRQASRPFVEAVTSGRGGGGAQVTEVGEAAVRLFEKVYVDFQHFVNREQENRPTPFDR
jgi:molybdate transport system regulatory protein